MVSKGFSGRIILEPSLETEGVEAGAQERKGVSGLGRGICRLRSAEYRHTGATGEARLAGAGRVMGRNFLERISKDHICIFE